MHCDLSASGDKSTVKEVIRRQFGDRHHPMFNGVESLIDNAPGTHVSITGSLGASIQRTHGTVVLTISAWTPTSE